MSLTVPQGAALTIGAVLGTGVIGLPALAAQTAGPASLVAWVAMVALSVPLATTFAALGARHPDPGGVSTYARRAFGPRAATVVGWCFFFAVIPGAPAAALFAGGYVAAATGGGRATTLLTAAAIISVVCLLNAGGVKVSGRAQLALAGLLAALLLAATVSALPHARLENLHPFAPHGWFAVLPAAAVLVWGFAGWEAVTSLAGEYRDPARDLPRVTVVALVAVAVLYLGVAGASVLVLGPATGSSEAPLAELLATGVGGGVRPLTAVVAVLLTIGTMNTYFAGGSKLGAALGRDGAFPAWFARGSRSGEVPRRSLAVIAALSLTALGLVALAGIGTKPVVLLTTGSFGLVYVVGTAAALRLLPRGSWSRRGAALALAVTALLLATTGGYLVWAGAVATAALAYEAWGRRRARAGPAAAEAEPCLAG